MVVEGAGRVVGAVGDAGHAVADAAGKVAGAVLQGGQEVAGRVAEAPGRVVAAAKPRFKYSLKTVAWQVGVLDFVEEAARVGVARGGSCWHACTQPATFPNGLRWAAPMQLEGCDAVSWCRRQLFEPCGPLALARLHCDCCS